MGGLIGMGAGGAARLADRPAGAQRRRPGDRCRRRSRASAATWASRAHWASVDEAADALLAISQGFGPHTREQWLALTRPMLRPTATASACTTTRRSRCRCAPITPELAARRRGRALAGLRRDPLPDAAAARRRVRPALARDRRRRWRSAARSARVHEFAGVGHAPTLVAADQVAAVREFLLAVAMKTRRPAASTRPPIVRVAAPTAGARDRLGRGRRREPARRPSARRAGARARSPSRCSSAARCDSGEDALAHAEGVAQILADHRRRAGDAGRGLPGLCRRRAAASPTRSLTRRSAPSHASLVDARAAKLGAAAARGAGRARRRRRARRCRPSACARCCSRSRATCAWCCCAWPRACRRCAGTRPASTPCPPELARESHAGVRAARQPAGHLADQVGDRGPGVPLPRARDLQARSPGCSTRSASSARRASSTLRAQLEAELRRARHRAPTVQGRPKHIYSIWKKMRGKALDFAQVFDIRALRVIVADVAACYAVLGRVHERYRADRRRVRRLHRQAQGQRLPVAAHRGARTTTGRADRDPDPHARRCTSTPSTAWPRTGPTRRPAPRATPASARRRVRGEGRAGAQGVLRQLLAWERDFVGDDARRRRAAEAPRRPRASTTASTSSRRRPRSSSCRTARRRSTSPTRVHTDLGHRCRGARVDGAMVPLQHAAAERPDGRDHRRQEGGPSLDWLNPELRLPAEPRARGQGARLVQRAGAGTQTVARGREAVEKLLQREGRTALKLEDLAAQLGFRQRRRAVRGGRQGRDTRCATSRRCCGRPSRRRGRRRRHRSCKPPRAPAARPAACWWSASTRC